MHMQHVGSAVNQYLVIVPTFNEAQSVQELLPQLLNLPIDILIVDDGSPDGTAQICRELDQGRGRINVLERSEKSGLGSAYLLGFAWGLGRGYRFLVEMDADGSHQVSDLSLLIQRASQSPDVDLLIGSRWVSGGKVVNWSKGRELLSRFANRYSKILLGGHVKDMTAGFRIYRADFLHRMNLATISSEGYCFQIEMTRRSTDVGGRILELPIIFIERKFGESKMSSTIVLEAMARVTWWGIQRPFRKVSARS